jgi:hypothetical protein
LTQYDKYPLLYGVENCEIYPPQPYGGKGPVPAVDGSMPAPTQQDIEAARRQCQMQADADRKQHKINDFKDTFGFLFIGSLLFSIHFYLARKHSK